MFLGIDVVVLKDALGAEIMHESVVLEVLADALDLGDVEWGLDVSVVGAGEVAPEGLFIYL